MSIQAIRRYCADVERTIRHGGSRNETSLRTAFLALLKEYAAARGLEVVTEIAYRTPAGTTVYPDATLKDALRQDWGYWESKDASDDLNREIDDKLRKGYPTSNILFEDTQTAVLYQDGVEVQRTPFADVQALDALLTTFVGYEPPRVHEFRAAIERFRADLPDLLEVLREMIAAQAERNAQFRVAREAFLALCQKSINPAIVMDDVREMIIQHILTEDIFITVFGDAQFHRENNIARELYRVTDTFYQGELRRNVERRIGPYVKAIKAAAAEIADHHEKQRFLKVVYETFYRAYNPAGADRLGIMYTPNEIVRFIVESADHLAHRHFGRFLADDDVEILDPATGTGTFITEVIEHLPAHRLPYKYAHEIHCNEVALLPYYIANLNIEYTYAQKLGQYVEFDNICFVDTLDNLGFQFANKQYDLFGVSAENLERIQRQNGRRISVIIGNPPYNANQLNENDNNKNREYPRIDRRVRETYLAKGTAQKFKYDMYIRFLRWASDRLDKNGILAFVSNNSFLEASSYDGLRATLEQEFNAIYVIDLKGDARTSGERRRREGGNVFEDQIRVGVAVYFLVKAEAASGCTIWYHGAPDYARSEDKRALLREHKIEDLAFEHLIPDARHTWLNQPTETWEDLLCIGNRETKQSSLAAIDQGVFGLYTLGVITARDDWAYDVSRHDLEAKVTTLVGIYNAQVQQLTGSVTKSTVGDLVGTDIKWTRDLKRALVEGRTLRFDPAAIRRALYRPYISRLLYYSADLNEMQYQTDRLFPTNRADNVYIAVNVGNKPFNVLAGTVTPDYHLNGDSQCFPRYRYDDHGNRLDNINDRAAAAFEAQYGGNPTPWPLKDAIFYYVYAVLHDPAYRDKYALNLKKEFPRLPFYSAFVQWAAWGKELLDLHVGYDSVTPYPLRRVDMEPDPNPPRRAPRPRLKADRDASAIIVDDDTTLLDVPPAAWEYRLGNRCALEWVLEYHKEKTPRDPTIRARFNTYRLTDHKEPVIDLLRRVTTVSVETARIVAQMRAASES